MTMIATVVGNKCINTINGESDVKTNYNSEQKTELLREMPATVIHPTANKRRVMATALTAGLLIVGTFVLYDVSLTYRK